jgi:dipeptidyl aminopeptidase/acylaminoacyl peptidase
MAVSLCQILNLQSWAFAQGSDWHVRSTRRGVTMKVLFPRLLLSVLSILLINGCSNRDDAAVEAVTEPDQPRLLSDFELVSRATYFGNPERTQGRISPDGSKMSFMAPLDGVLNVWVGPLGDFAGAEPVTNDKMRGVGQHQWALNGRNVLYLRDQGGDEDFHIYSVDLETGETIDLTPFEKTTGIFVGGSYRYADEYLIGMNNRDARWHDVWRVNVRTGDRQLVEQHDRFSGFVADLDLNLRLAFEPTSDGGQMVYKRLQSGEWDEFFKIEKEDALTTNVLAFTEDGNQFLMLDSSGRDKSALLRVDFETDDRTIIAENPSADISEVIVNPETNEPLAYSVNHLRKDWYGLTENIEEDLDLLRGTLTGDISVLAQTRDDRLWTVVSDGAKNPLTYFAFDRSSGDVKKMFTARPDLDGKPLNEMHPVSITSRDGLELVSYLTLPPHADADGDGRPENPVPMVLDVHGGPWARNEYGYTSWSQWLSNRGYAVLNVNYRGSTGFGKGFLNAGDKQWAADMHNDLIDAVDWAISENIAPADKIAIAGGSYGGYATLVGLTFTPETFACGVDIVGPSNLVTLLESIPPYWASFLETFAQRVGDPRTEEGQKFLRSRSPLFLSDQIVRPLLIGQGANDPRVKQPESDQIVAAMQGNELPVTYVLYPDEGHGFARPENRESFYAIMEAFLAECLGGRSEEFGDALVGSSVQVPVGAEHITGLGEALEGFEPVIKK